MTDCAKVAPPPRTTEGELLLLHGRTELPHYALLAKNAL